MSLKINKDKVQTIKDKITSFVGENKFGSRVGIFKTNAKLCAGRWPGDGNKIDFLKKSQQPPKHPFMRYRDAFGNPLKEPILDYDAYDRAKRDMAKKILCDARDAAKGYADGLDASKLTNAVADLQAIANAMDKILTLCENFDATEVPDFESQVSDAQTARVERLRGKYGVADPNSPGGLFGALGNGKGSVGDLINATGVPTISPNTTTIKFPEGYGNYSDTGADIGKHTKRGIPDIPVSDPATDSQGEQDALDDYYRRFGGVSGSSGGNPNDDKDGNTSRKPKLDDDGGYGIVYTREPDPGKDPYPKKPQPRTEPPSIHDVGDKPTDGSPGGNGGSGKGDTSGSGGSSNENTEITTFKGTSDDLSSPKVADDPKIKDLASLKEAQAIIGGSKGSDLSADPFDSNNKNKLAGALGIVTGGSTFGMPSGIGGTAASGADLFSGMNGLGGVNIPNVSIGGYNPYSINIGSGSALNFSNFDSSNLYNNVNFYTTPGLDTIQSPNQLLEHLNSLPESVRKKIASMDLDNRAESAYYNSMSNEEFDEVKQKQITKFRSMTKEQIKERLKKQGYTDEEIEIIANNENIGVIAFLVGEQNVTMEALRKAITPDGVVLEEDKDERPSLEELVSGEAAAKLLNPYQDEEVRKAVEEYEYAKEKFNRAVSKSNASSKALKVANEKLRKTRIDIEQIDGKDINKWTKEHIVKYNDCVKIFMEEKENATNDLIATLNAEKEFQVAMEALKEAKAKFNKKMAEAVSVDPSVLLLIEQNKKKKENGEETEKEPKQEPFAMISKKMVMPDLQMHNIDDVEILEETGSLSASDKAVVEQSVSQSVETYQTEQPVVENKPAENVPKEETVGSMEINGKKIQITKPTNNFVEAPEKE